MSILAYTKTFFKTFPYPFLSRKKQLEIQEKNLKDILKYAKNNSEYYRTRINDELDFSKIEPINKQKFLDNFDEIITDKSIKFSDVQNFIINTDNDGLRINNKYSVAMTSGSTGNPTVIVQDDNYQNTSSVTNFFRNIKVRLPIIMLGETGGYGLESSVIKENLRKAKSIKLILKIIDSQDPIDKIIDQLIEAGSGVLIAYTGILRIVSNRMIERGITLKEKQIFVSGEKCFPADKKRISEAFGNSDVRIMYGCTETGLIACECKCGHLHIASDCVKVEAVDINNQSVGYDKLSDKILITNLMNKVQPIIRYEVTDRIVLHKGCECGCKDDWLEIEGRSNDDIIFVVNKKEIHIPSISFLIKMAEINKNGLDKFRNFQVAVSKKGVLEIALDYFETINKEEVNKEIVDELKVFFENYKVSNIKYKFSDSTKFVRTRGKFKRVYMKD